MAAPTLAAGLATTRWRPLFKFEIGQLYTGKTIQFATPMMIGAKTMIQSNATAR